VPFERRQLRRLPAVDVFCLEMARRQRREGGDGGKKQGTRERLLGKLDVSALEQIPGRNRHHEECAKDKSADPHVEQPLHGRGIEDESPEIDDLGSKDRRTVDHQRLAIAQNGHDVVTCGRLLPAVGDHNPDRRKNRSKGHHDCRE
jgi:hypothetical protein